MSGEKSEKPRKSEPFDDDDVLMKSLAGLVECENATRHDPHGFIKYKLKVKETLEVLLSKLERNHLYEKYLETEIEEFEERILLSSHNGAEGSTLDEIRDEDFPSLPTDEQLDTADSVELIHRHTVSQLQDTIHELHLKEFTQAQAYEARIESLERQLNARDAEMVEYALHKERELDLVGTVLISLRKKIDTIGYNIAVRSNLPFPPPRVLPKASNGHSVNGPHSPLEQYLTGHHKYTTKELLEIDHHREHFLSQFENDDEESFYEGDDDDEEEGGGNRQALSRSYDEGDGESVDYKNQLLERYDLDDEELSQLEEEREGDLAGEIGAVVEVGYEELDGMESKDDMDPLRGDDSLKQGKEVVSLLLNHSNTEEPVISDATEVASANAAVSALPVETVPTEPIENIAADCVTSVA